MRYSGQKQAVEQVSRVNSVGWKSHLRSERVWRLSLKGGGWHTGKVQQKKPCLKGCGILIKNGGEVIEVIEVEKW
jgi:hypothetical protein